MRTKLFSLRFGGCVCLALAGTFSPNAAFVQTPFAVTATRTYTLTLTWKANKPAQNATIVAGAGPIGGRFSPTSLTLQTIGCT